MDHKGAEILWFFKLHLLQQHAMHHFFQFEKDRSMNWLEMVC